VFTVNDVKYVPSALLINKIKVVGPDLIHPRILKVVADILCQSLCNLFNTSLRLCKFRTKWNIANVSPKKDDAAVVNNYRPI